MHIMSRCFISEGYLLEQAMSEHADSAIKSSADMQFSSVFWAGISIGCVESHQIKYFDFENWFKNLWWIIEERELQDLRGNWYFHKWNTINY